MVVSVPGVRHRRHRRAEGDGDLGAHARQRLRQDDVQRPRPAAEARSVVEPVNAEQIGGVGHIGQDIGQPRIHGWGDFSWIGQFGETGQNNLPSTQEIDDFPPCCGIINPAREVERTHTQLASHRRFAVRSGGWF
jgi:hypothetical protein